MGGGKGLGMRGRGRVLYGRVGGFSSLREESEWQICYN